MASPLPPLVGSSPFPFPLPSFSPFPHNPPTNPNNPSPLPFSTPSVPAGAAGPSGHIVGATTTANLFTWPSSSPLPLFSGAGSAFPSSTPTGAPSHSTGLTPLLPLPLPFPAGYPSPADPSHPRPPGGEKGEYGELRRGVESFGQGLERCLSVVHEIRRMEQGLFEPAQPQQQFGRAGEGPGGRSEGMEVGLLGGLSKLELLHLEYTQLISSLIALSITTHLSSLPSPLSQALAPADPASAPDPPADPEPGAGAGRPVTIDDLTVWAEQRANLEFNRREAVRVSAKTVLDVLAKR